MIHKLSQNQTVLSDSNCMDFSTRSTYKYGEKGYTRKPPSSLRAFGQVCSHANPILIVGFLLWRISKPLMKLAPDIEHKPYETNKHVFGFHFPSTNNFSEMETS